MYAWTSEWMNRQHIFVHNTRARRQGSFRRGALPDPRHSGNLNPKRFTHSLHTHSLTRSFAPDRNPDLQLYQLRDCLVGCTEHKNLTLKRNLNPTLTNPKYSDCVKTTVITSPTT